MDKNLSQIFIIWDKLFGTFQPELKNVPPVYGISRPARTWNPIRINFQHLGLLVHDAFRTKSWKERFTLWFQPTGYRPADVAEKYPVHRIRDVYNFQKYDTRSSRVFGAWAWLQLVSILLLGSYLFARIAYIDSLNATYIYWYGVFVFLSVYALTELMDRNRYAVVWEGLRCLCGLGLIYWQQDWFGSSAFFSFAPYIIGAWLIMSMVGSAWFVLKHDREDRA